MVDPNEAAVVRRIIEQYRAGDGQRTIAVELNRDQVPSPRAGKHGTGSWSPSAIRAILTTPRYAGRGRYNQTRKLYRGGTKVREPRAPSEHIEYETPAIIDQELFQQVEQRFERNQRFGETKTTSGARPRYLLTGHVRCAACGGPSWSRTDAMAGRIGACTCAGGGVTAVRPYAPTRSRPK